jgi:peptidoglycan/LPS O-acetylase OafA/YrhL
MSLAIRENHIPSLDGIRGLAALLVFTSHVTRPDQLPGGFGVTVFFFLSGYLITTLLRTEYERHGDINFRRFYLSRVYRIMPPMYIVLGIMLLLCLAGLRENEMTVAGVLAQMTHFTNYYFAFFGERQFVTDTSPLWSLAVEEHFYLLFPMALLLLLRRLPAARVATLLLATCGLVLAWRCWGVFVLGWGEAYTYHASDTRVDSILFGCVLGLRGNPALEARRVTLARPLVYLMLSACAVMLLVSFLIRSPAFRETLRYSLQGVALFGFFFCAVRYHDWRLFSWLDSRPMRALGLVSFTVYLVHLPILGLLAQYTTLGEVGRAVSCTLGTALVSTAMYLLVERHMAALRRRLHGSRSRPAADPAIMPRPAASAVL